MRRSRRCAGASLVFSALLFATAPAGAEVLELSPEGVVSVRDGGGAAVWKPQENGTHSDEPRDAVITPASSLAVPAEYSASLQRAAEAADISPTLLSALVWQESGWNPGARSPKGAIGLTQLMPGTARELGVDPTDPAENLAGGARYLRALLNAFNGDVVKALAAYNAGPARVRRSNGVPPLRETQAYVSAIVQRLSSTVLEGMWK